MFNIPAHFWPLIQVIKNILVLVIYRARKVFHIAIAQKLESVRRFDFAKFLMILIT